MKNPRPRTLKNAFDPAIIPRIAGNFRIMSAEFRKDLEQVGWETLIKCDSNFKPTNGTPFEAYASMSIRREMAAYARRYTSPVTYTRNATKEEFSAGIYPEELDTLPPGSPPTPEELYADKELHEQLLELVQLAQTYFDAHMAEHGFPDENIDVMDYLTADDRPSLHSPEAGAAWQFARGHVFLDTGRELKCMHPAGGPTARGVLGDGQGDATVKTRPSWALERTEWGPVGWLRH